MRFVNFVKSGQRCKISLLTKFFNLKYCTLHNNYMQLWHWKLKQIRYIVLNNFIAVSSANMKFKKNVLSEKLKKIEKIYLCIQWTKKFRNEYCKILGKGKNARGNQMGKKYQIIIYQFNGVNEKNLYHEIIIVIIGFLA